ncbi:MAG: hypothetical protein EOO25_00595 [Comamonadaceae bacterium]|nr:MAG: hypothetical protein EOO25_00595 [Comamonadaceae bacterium]
MNLSADNSILTKSHPENVQRRWSDGANLHLPNPSAPWSMEGQWPSVVATLSEQAVETSNLVGRALDFLVSAGRLRRAEAKVLSDTLERLKGTSLRAQQITRLASGRIRQAKDRVDLAEVVRTMLQERAQELGAMGASVKGVLNPVDVLLDPPVAVSLVNTLVDWALSFSKDIELSLQTPVYPAPAQLQVRIVTPPPSGTGAAGTRTRRLDDGLHWILLRQIAAAAGLSVARAGGDGIALLTLGFPQTFLSTDGVSTVELFDDLTMATGVLQDSSVLVIARDPQMRQTALSALKSAGLPASGVNSAQEARRVIADGRFTVLVVAYDAHDDDFEALRTQLVGANARCTVVHITAEPASFHDGGFDGTETIRVAREAVAKELAPVIFFELAKLA